MNQGKRCHSLSGLALIAILLASSGCRFLSSGNRQINSASSLPSSGQAPSSARTEITSIPDVTITDMDATGRELTAAGLIVMVKRERLVVSPMGNSGQNSFVLPEIIQSFQPSQWNHMIAAQYPAAGTPVRPGSVVTLTAGIHHGAGPFRSWLNAHGGSVKLRGERRCRDCHTQSYCSDCHNKVGTNPIRKGPQ